MGIANEHLKICFATITGGIIGYIVFLIAIQPGVGSGSNEVKNRLEKVDVGNTAHNGLLGSRELSFSGTDPIRSVNPIASKDLVIQIRAEQDQDVKATLIGMLSKQEGLSKLDFLFGVVGDDKGSRIAIVQAFVASGLDRKQAELVLSYANKGSERNAWGGLYAGHFPVSDHEMAVDFVMSNLTGSARTRVVRLIYNRIIKEDIEMGARTVLELPQGASLRKTLMIPLIQRMTKEDPAIAIDWIVNLDDPVEREAALKLLSTAWVFQEPQAAIDFGKSITTQPERIAFNRMVAAYLGGEDPIRGLDWARDLDVPEDERKRMVSYVFSLWGYYDPNSAVMAIEAGNYNEDAKAELRIQVIGYLADTDPKKAWEWVANWPESKQQTLAANSVAKHWINKDPLEASEWIRDMKKGEIRDNAIKRLIQIELSRSPTEALTWALEISESSDRMRATSRAMKEVNTLEARKQILEYIKEAELSEDEKVELLKSMPAAK